MNRSFLDSLFFIGRPLSPIYGLLMKARRIAYKKGLLKSEKMPGFTISIGNITLGGTGKSPHVYEIAKFVFDLGLRPAIISRGYGGQAGKGPVVVNPKGKIEVSSKICGDEPYMLAQKIPNVPVVVGSDRTNACRHAFNNLGCNVFILDDAFQHLKVKKDIDIVLISARRPFGNGKIFPGGQLREPLDALNDANSIILTKTNQITGAQLDQLQTEVSFLLNKGQLIFKSHYFIESIFDSLNTQIGFKDLKSKKIFAFCGIADPDSFKALIKSTKFNLKGFLAFKDHHFYCKKDLTKIINQAIGCGADCVLTTEKDLAKIDLSLWNNLSSNIPLMIVSLKTYIDDKFWFYLRHKLQDFKKTIPNK